MCRKTLEALALMFWDLACLSYTRCGEGRWELRRKHDAIKRREAMGRMSTRVLQLEHNIP